MNTPNQNLETRARRFWVALVLLLMGLQISLGAIAIRLATASEQSKIVPDYHQAALAWDRVHRERNRLATLGWNVSQSVHATSTGSELQLDLVDQTGLSVGDLTITAWAYHHSTPDQVVKLTFAEQNDGGYYCEQLLAPAGVWELQLEISTPQGLAKPRCTLEVPKWES